MLVRVDEPKRLTVAERFRGQRDLLTGDDVVPQIREVLWYEKMCEVLVSEKASSVLRCCGVW